MALVQIQVYGPDALDQSPETLVHARDQLDAARRLIEAMKREVEQADAEGRDFKARPEWAELIGALADWGFGARTLPDLNRAGRCLQRDVVDDLLAFWPAHSTRASCITQPGNPSQIIVSVCDDAGSDNPEDFGYQTLRNASIAGLFPIFGIT